MLPHCRGQTSILHASFDTLIIPFGRERGNPESMGLQFRRSNQGVPSSWFDSRRSVTHRQCCDNKVLVGKKHDLDRLAFISKSTSATLVTRKYLPCPCGWNIGANGISHCTRENTEAYRKQMENIVKHKKEKFRQKERAELQILFTLFARILHR